MIALTHLETNIIPLEEFYKKMVQCIQLKETATHTIKTINRDALHKYVVSCTKQQESLNNVITKVSQ